MKYIIVEDGDVYGTDTVSESVIQDCGLGYLSIINTETSKYLTVDGWVDIDIWRKEQSNEKTT